MVHGTHPWHCCILSGEVNYFLDEELQLHHHLKPPLHMFVGLVWNETMYCTWFICCLITYKVKEKSKKC